MRPRLLALVTGGVVCLQAGCGGSQAPSEPTPPGQSLPSIQVSVSPNPIKATILRVSGEVLECELIVEVTFRETAGGSGRLKQIDTTVAATGPSGVHQAGLRMNVDLPFAGPSSVTATYRQEFDAGSDAARVTWKISAEGTDSQGRNFSVPQFEFPVVLMVAPLPIPGTRRIVVFGGTNADVFLGCLSCSEHDTDSIHNPSGPYGSPFSWTSIWNRSSPYGSLFSADSACNASALNPPIVVDEAGTAFYGELTVSRSRPLAITDPDIVSWLGQTVCGV